MGLHLLPEWLGLSTCTVTEDDGPSSASSLSNYANMMGVGSEEVSYCLPCNSLVALLQVSS